MKALVLAHGLDLVTVLGVFALYGVTGEANPIVRAVYLSAGVLGLLAVKVVLVGGLGLVRERLAGRWAFVRFVGVAAGLLGAGTNVLAVLAR